MGWLFRHNLSRVALAVLLLALASSAQRAPAQCEARRLLANDGDLRDLFGSSVAVYHDSAAVGAYLHNDPNENSGAVFVFDGQTGWDQVQELHAPNETGRGFGGSVAMPEGQLAVGSVWHGSVFLYSPTSDGTWELQAQLGNRPEFSDGWLGWSVGTSPGRIIAGAPADTDNGFFAGAAYVFERQGDGAWIQVAKLLASDGDGNDEFGFSVDIDGDVAVVGAHWDDDAGMSAGSAYVFERDPVGTWVQRGKLLGQDTDDHDQFGSAVAVYGATILIGAPVAAVAHPTSGGAAYVFERDVSGAWIQTFQIVPGDNDRSDDFGMSIALQGNTAIIGANVDDDRALNAGAAYVYRRESDATWAQAAKLYASDAEERDEFGSSVAIDGGTVVVGAPQPFTGPTVGTGKAYVFDLAGHDCNANGRCDSLDIQEGSSPDDNANGWPDECEAGDCAADLNADGAVDTADLIALLSNFGLRPDQNPTSGDVDGDGDVDLADLSALLTEHGLYCP